MGKMMVGGRVIEPLSLDDALNGCYGQIIMGIVDSLLAASGDVDWDEAKAIAVELEAGVSCVG